VLRPILTSPLQCAVSGFGAARQHDGTTGRRDDSTGAQVGSRSTLVLASLRIHSTAAATTETRKTSAASTAPTMTSAPSLLPPLLLLPPSAPPSAPSG